MEILQGIRDEKTYHKVTEYLIDFQYFPTITEEFFLKSVEIYRTCQQKGITIRKSSDCLIAANAIVHDLVIVHKDRDFENIKRVFPDLVTRQPQ